MRLLFTPLRFPKTSSGISESVTSPSCGSAQRRPRGGSDDRELLSVIGVIEIADDSDLTSVSCFPGESHPDAAARDCRSDRHERRGQRRRWYPSCRLCVIISSPPISLVGLNRASEEVLGRYGRGFLRDWNRLRESRIDNRKQGSRTVARRRAHNYNARVIRSPIVAPDIAIRVSQPRMFIA